MYIKLFQIKRALYRDLAENSNFKHINLFEFFLIIISLWSNLSYFIVLVHIWWVFCRSPIILNLLIIHQFLRILNFSEYYINQFIKTKILASTWNLDSMEYYSKAFCPTQCVWGPHVLDCLFPATLSPVQM